MKLDLLNAAKADLKACVRYYNSRPQKHGGRSGRRSSARSL